MHKISQLLSSKASWFVIATAVFTFFVPGAFHWVSGYTQTVILGVIMLSMGLTLTTQDFRVLFSRPGDIFIGACAQFTIMPLLAFFLGKAFGLEAGLMAGVILVGTCPGGTASNVMTYLSKGDVALSVGMTSVNTVLAPFLTPAITYLLLKTTVSVDVVSMFVSIIKVVIIPIALGFLINGLWGKHTEKVADVLPLVSVTAIALIVAAVVSHNSARILETGAQVFAVVILHNLLGYAVGYLLALAFRMPMSRKKALAIEIGMQNSGLATSLAGTAFPGLAMATVPGAVFSVWHNISGALLANLFRRMK